MLTAKDQETAESWRRLGARIGRRACHGSAHQPDAETAWVRSAYEDVKAICVALEILPPGYSHRFGEANDWWPDLGRVLDFGAGACRLEPWLCQMASEVVAIDACADLLTLAPRIPNLALAVVSDPTTLRPQVYGLFDTIACLHVAYSMTPDGMIATVGALARLLAPGGALVIDVPHRPKYAVWENPDPDGLPGGWWVHLGSYVETAAEEAFLKVDRRPAPILWEPAWPDLAPLALWVLRKGV